MKRLLRLYPAAWRRRYGDEMAQLLDDLGPMSAGARLRTGADLMHGAMDAHLTKGMVMSPQTRTALRRAVVIAVVVWAGLSTEVVLTNVVFPSVEDDDGVSVLVAYTAVLAALLLTGMQAGRATSSRRTHALAGAVAGALIAVATIATFAVVDNVFLDTISRQQAKIDGLAHSGMTSMRAYVNLGLAVGAVGLAAFFGAAGAGLAVLGGIIAQRRRAAPATEPETGT
ncbi:hypothetical protein ACIA5D_39385 [Actinoplanes sp. NPDC051513]|uniref:hypothetical protein n=1 Tax=Actinoplanes sp. NPDC051513 TaxID=3363908 RepID=UPI003798B234